MASKSLCFILCNYQFIRLVYSHLVM